MAIEQALRERLIDSAFGPPVADKPLSANRLRGTGGNWHYVSVVGWHPLG